MKSFSPVKTNACSSCSAVVVADGRRRQRHSNVACRAAPAPAPGPLPSSSSSSSSSAREHDLDVDVSVRNRRAMLAQGAAIAAAAALAMTPPLAALADDDDRVSIDAVDAPAEAAVATPTAPAAPALDAEFATLSDPTLAYSFRYPISVAKTGANSPSSSSNSSKGAPSPNVLRLNLVPSRRPERYSSAAPLSPDARQRIVCELVDLQQSVTVSVTVGPPATTAMLLPSEERARLASSSSSSSSSSNSDDPSRWSPRSVAEAVLVDRSTARTTTGQRLALNSVERAEVVDRSNGNGNGNSSNENDGITSSRYFLYEHLAQGSPSERSVVAGTGAKETYRHAWAITGVRRGKGNGVPYLYTLNLSCPQELWPLLNEAFRASAESFELASEPGRGFVSPDAQPWRFF